jgi:CheY-like chemotaxis protein
MSNWPVAVVANPLNTEIFKPMDKKNACKKLNLPNNVPLILFGALGGQKDPRKGFDLLILDGETSPAGGLGLSRQLKDEIYNCPPILVLVARMDDRWLATWSRADGVVAHPIDPRALVKAVLNLLKPVNPRARQAISK